MSGKWSKVVQVGGVFGEKEITLFRPSRPEADFYESVNVWFFAALDPRKSCGGNAKFIARCSKPQTKSATVRGDVHPEFFSVEHFE